MHALTPQVLDKHNRRFRGTGGRSPENRESGFLPAFWDALKDTVYLSRFADGRLAPIHMFDGLPAETILERAPSGRVAKLKPSITAGFVRAGRFYTRTQAARAVQGSSPLESPSLGCASINF